MKLTFEANYFAVIKLDFGLRMERSFEKTKKPFQMLRSRLVGIGFT